MASPFDAATKFLIERHPADWLAYAGIEVDEVEIVDADLASITAAADKVLRVKAPIPCLCHLELQSSYESEMAERFHFYSAVLRWRHKLPILSIIVLLRPEADGPGMSGELRYNRPDGSCYEWFKYEVVRVWQKPVEEVLGGGIGTLPLAPLAGAKPDGLPDVIRQMDSRIRRNVSVAEANDLWAATLLLMGLRYPPAVSSRLLQGVRNMRESSTYQMILEEGRAEGEARGEVKGERNVILRVGENRFGPPDKKTVSALEAITDTAGLERLVERLMKVESWQELLADQ